MSDFKANMHQIVRRMGFRLRPRWGSSQRFPRPLNWILWPTSKEGEGSGPPVLPLHPSHYILDKGLTCTPCVHPLTEWTIPAFAFPAEADTHLPTSEGWKAELALEATASWHFVVESTLV